MFKYIHKLTPYLDQTRLDLKLKNKRKRNYRYKDKVVYTNDKTIFCKDITKNRYYYKYLNYIFNEELSHIHFMNMYNLKNNILHRNHNKPTIIDCDNNKFWFKNGKLHRENEPACHYQKDDKYWFKNGYLHRDDGKPAVSQVNGKILYWYENGYFIKDNFDPNGPRCFQYNT